MSVVALVSDLMMQSQVSAAGERVGVSLSLNSTPDALVRAAELTPPRLIVIDLSHPGLAIDELVARLRTVAPDAPIVAFGPHVHKDRLSAAQAAGCDRVVSRGQFHAQMDELLTR
jgi:CheY-like chemotaxis protein